MVEPKYKRILLKLSGEALAGDKSSIYDNETLIKTCENIKKIHDLGIEVGIVVGGGNIWRGSFGVNMERETSDSMGMLATIINSLAIKATLESIGVEAEVFSGIDIPEVVDRFNRKEAIKLLEEKKVIVFSWGVGHPYFSTDSAAALRAIEIRADAILVGKTIDGVYDSDPKENPNAIKYDEITFSEVLDKNLKVMDAAAISLCRDNKMPLIVFGIKDEENIIKAINGEKIGTLIKGE